MKPLAGKETQTFLEEMPNLVLGTIRRDGSPQASPVWYLWNGKSFLISTISSVAKWYNVQRDPRCSVCVDDPSTGRMVVAYGQALLHSGDVRDRTRTLVEKYYPGEPDAANAHLERIFSGPDQRVLIELFPSVLIPRRLDVAILMPEPSR